MFSQNIFDACGLTLYKIYLNESLCDCTFNSLGPTSGHNSGVSFGPDTVLYYLGNNVIRKVDTLNGNYQTIFTGPSTLPEMDAFVSVGNGIFYSMPTCIAMSDTLYKWDLNTGLVTAVGAAGYNSCFEMTMFDGNIYYISIDGIPGGMASIIHLDVLNPPNSQLLVSFPQIHGIFGLTASPFCNTLLGAAELDNKLVLISLIDGAITPICGLDFTNGNNMITSMLEHTEIINCTSSLDIDCNDSSGATDADYNSPDFNCLSDGVGIADEDIRMLYDAIISTMTIQVTGFIPDAPNEIFNIIGTVPNINAIGAGTDMMTLTNTGGATSREFKDALRLVRYINSASSPTGGLRTVEVQFTTESGESSNIATAFIHLEALPLIEVELGSDQEFCEGASVTLNAGNPGATYSWSTGDNTQSITVSQSGQYIVTVSDGINCPGCDTVELDLLPVIHVSLIGDLAICDNESATLMVQTDAPFALDIDIASDPGSPFSFMDVNGDFSFMTLPTQNTTYTITQVTSSQDACIEINDGEQIVDVHPTYVVSTDASICDGDSIWLGFFWISVPGLYTYFFNTLHGCDSVVNTNVTILPAIQVAQNSTTCDSASAGVFVTFLNNQNGCDTMVTTTVALLTPDTTLIHMLTCNSTNVGTTTQVLTNQTGCDSLILTTTSWIPPADTTMLIHTTCDSALHGVFEEILIDQSGCDSLIITSITSGLPDTTLLFTTSCDSSELSVHETHFTASNQCDSTVITTVTFSAQDSTFITGGSCDPAEVGDFVQMLINRLGCDSIVTTTVSLLSGGETFISSSTCDPNSAGDFDYMLINQFACDSIVHETISLLPSSTTFLSSTTCTSSQAGTFITTLQNEFGCDSIVTLMVLLIPADTTQLISKTCDPAQVGSTQNIFTNQIGCDSLVIQTTELFPLPQLNVAVTSDFNGYGVSCFDEDDGSAIAHVTGVGPYQYVWSSGHTDQSSTGLSAGLYVVTITDGNGCETQGSVMITEPSEFSIGFEVAQPDCFGRHQGTITVMQTGGVEPIRYSIDGINFQSSPTFNDLSGGTYHVTSLDANDCEVKEIIWINVPIMVHVDLGDDMIILPGDTTVIEAIVNVPFDSLSSINWSGLINANCPTCLTQPVAPIITTTYSVTVTSHDGCADEDSMTLFVDKNNDIYVPNIFSPNGDQINDRLLISAGKDVEKISSFTIYDRWGDMVFLAKDFFPNDLNYAWDGKVKGRQLNPGVFAYRLVAVHKDGRSEFRYGDVTLMN